MDPTFEPSNPGSESNQENQVVRPSRLLYLLALVIFAAGWVGFGLDMFSGLRGMDDKFQRVVVPGTSVINLREAGDYTIFHEYRSVVGNKIYSTEEQLSGLEVKLGSKTTGAPVPISPSTGSGTYEFGGRAGTAVFSFSIKDPGDYELSASYPQGKEGPDVVLAVTRGFETGLVSTVLGSLGILFTCLLISAALAIYTLVKRYDANKNLKAARAASGSYFQG
jgi:hypothetical protein